MQALNYESGCYKATERSLKQERTNIRDFISFLDILEVPRRPDLYDNTNIGIIWLERNGINRIL